MRIRKIGAVILAAGVLIQSAKSGAELTESKQELIREMLAFYRTPVGRKSIEVMPSLVQEAGRGVDEAVQPLAVGLIQEIVAEERAKLAD